MSNYNYPCPGCDRTYKWHEDMSACLRADKQMEEQQKLNTAKADELDKQKQALIEEKKRIRREIAAQVLAGLVAGPDMGVTPQTIIKGAVRYADGLLRELENEPT